MIESANSTSILLTLTSEAMVPFVNGCARIVGKKEALRFKRAIDYFGPPVAAKWREWSRSHQPEEIRAELERLGSLSEEQARRATMASLTRFATASPSDQETAIDYVAAIPANVARYVPRQVAEAAPLPWPLDREQDFLGFLPIQLPPFSPGSNLVNTPYRLESVLGSGEIGVVYRVTNPSDPSQKRVIKFCLDNALVGSLAHEREHLNRLLTLGLARWSPGIARLFGYNLDTQIPYLMYEFCPGVDLSREVRRVRQETGGGFTAEKTLELVTQIAAALAFAHGRGLIYGDLKPANVLLSDESRVMSDEPKTAPRMSPSSLITRHSSLNCKLTDFGTTAASAGLAAQTCPVSSREGAPLVSAATHARLLHGSNTSMYMCGEVRRGDRPAPHHDLYSLGVLWYQVLVGDVTREMHPGWAEELVSECQTPKKHVEVLQRCVGYYKRRPASAADLLPMLQSLTPVGEERAPVSFVSERLRKLDERFARAGRAFPETAPTETEVIPKTADSDETLWGQETRLLGAGFVPRPGASPAQINRDAELARLKRLLNDQIAHQAYQEARETLEVLRHLHPHDPEVQEAYTFLTQNQ